MKETWRWFGPLDKIDLRQIKQTGAKGIVTALHEVPYGEIWSSQQITERHNAILSEGMCWDVVESLPIHEDIKRGEGDLDTLFANYRQSLHNLAGEGIKTVCYNFMPVLDWTRTRLDAPVANGGKALRFDMIEYAAFDLHMLGRESRDHSAAVIQAATNWFEQSTSQQRDVLTHSIMSGLPGAYMRYDASGLREELTRWQGFTADDLRASLKRFVDEVMPTASELGIRMCVHPDDPPRPLFGLPRIFSKQEDFEYLVGLNDDLANGITLCAGSLGANPENYVPKIAEKFAKRIHFAHLRNVLIEDNGSFQESEHLDGAVRMPLLVWVLLQEEKNRKAEDRDDCIIPFRPDHGHELLSDSELDTHPGYPLVGRLRGLAEIRGVIDGLNYANAEWSQFGT